MQIFLHFTEDWRGKNAGICFYFGLLCFLTTIFCFKIVHSKKTKTKNKQTKQLHKQNKTEKYGHVTNDNRHLLGEFLNS